MTSRLLNVYYSRLSYLKRRKLAFFPLRSKSERSLCSKRNGDSSKENSELNNDHKRTEKAGVKDACLPQTEDDKKVIAKRNLAALLSELKVDDGFSNIRSSTKLNLSKPPQRMNRKKNTENEQSANEHSDVEEKVLLAVKDIASTAGDHSKEIETDLINGITSIQNATDDDVTVIATTNTEITDEVSENVMSAVKAVASTVVEHHEVKSDLTKKLLELAFQKGAGTQATPSRESMIGLFEGMKIDKKQQPPPDEKQVLYSKQQEGSFSRQRPIRPKLELQKVNLFDSPPLDIFNTKTEDLKGQSDSTKLFLWNMLMEKELKSLVQFAPTNAFEEMIQLTEQGKYWTFPIDNEIDMGEEENVGFHEHVFLDYLLEGFPKKGPIRHFMELVVTGLSKNPYITVDRKKENIEWFRQYFEEKKSILQQYES